MQQKSPKDFWNYVNSLNTKLSNPDIKLDALHGFFKTLNSIEHDDVVEGDIKANNLDSGMLNCEISEYEIMKWLKKLKNGKCPGIDEIMNEYIKVSCSTFMPIYFKLFNLILESGHIPVLKC